MIIKRWGKADGVNLTMHIPQTKHELWQNFIDTFKFWKWVQIKR